MRLRVSRPLRVSRRESAAVVVMHPTVALSGLDNPFLSRQCGSGNPFRSKKDTMDLADKTALVTGSTSGIGREIALLLAEEGATVIVSGRNAEAGAETVRNILDKGGQARFVGADLTDLDSLRHLAEQAGDVDVLV